MRSTILLILVALLTHTPLLAAYKILVSSHLTQQQAFQAKKRIAQIFHNNSYYQAHQSKEGYRLYSYPSGKYFVVTIEPIHREKVLNALLHIAREYNSNAFASYSTKQYEETSIMQKLPNETPLAHPQKKDTGITPEKAVKMAAAKQIQNPESSKYLRTKNLPKQEENSPTILYLYATIFALILAMFILIVWLLKLKQKLAAQHKAISTERLTTIPQRETPQLFVDIHSHLIPGIDDGVKNMEESIALVKKFHHLGYKKIITTPHIMSHRYANNSQTLRNGLTLLRERIAQEHLDIQVEIASEYYLDDHLMNLIAQFDILTFGSHYLLFEMSYINHPVNLEAMIEVMIEAGYTPVLAHPERYVYMSKNFSKYQKLKALGVLFQLNMNSITGYYSEEVKQLAHRLIDAGMIDFIGSDVHHMRHMQSIEKVMQTQDFRNIFQNNTILNNTL